MSGNIYWYLGMLFSIASSIGFASVVVLFLKLAKYALSHSHSYSHCR
jgi:hypothetical protein